jgi:hypothetical protein
VDVPSSYFHIHTSTHRERNFSFSLVLTLSVYWGKGTDNENGKSRFIFCSSSDFNGFHTFYFSLGHVLLGRPFDVASQDMLGAMNFLKKSFC